MIEEEFIASFGGSSSPKLGNCIYSFFPTNSGVGYAPFWEKIVSTANIIMPHTNKTDAKVDPQFM